MNRTLISSTSLIIGAILFFAVNILSSVLFQSARLDLTDNNLYTLSDGSKNIVKALEEPVTLRFYLSEKLLSSLAGINSYTTRVRELLAEYERASGGNIRLQVIDPEPFSEAEDKAVGYGLQGVPIDDSNTVFYFGLVGTNSIDGQEIIGFFQPNREEFLEYDITQMIYKLSDPAKKTVGLMSSLEIEGTPASNPFAGGGTDGWMMVEQIKQLFDVQTVAMDSNTIPSDIDVLMLVHPKNLSDATLYAIDQFVLNGGRLLAFVDPYAESDEPPADPQNPLSGMNAPRNSDLSKLFDAWGIEMAKNQIVADLPVAKQVRVRKGQGATVVNYPVWMDIRPEQMDSNDIITAKLDSVTFASAGILSKKADSKVNFIPLIQSTDQAAQIETSKLGMFTNPKEILRDYVPRGEAMTMAARVTGKVKSAFDSKPATSTEGEEQAKTDKDTTAVHLSESKEDINIIIVADTDMLEDQFWVQVQNFLGQRIALPNAANDKFVTNALDNLTGSNDLISVRNRGSFSRPFTRVEQIKLEAEQQFRDKEQQLQAQLSETEKKITQLQSQKQDGGSLILSPEQRAEIMKFRDQKVTIRKQLRQVQHELQKNIESLEGRMKFINIGLVPLLIGFGGLYFAGIRNRRRRLKSQY